MGHQDVHVMKIPAQVFGKPDSHGVCVQEMAHAIVLDSLYPIDLCKGIQFIRSDGIVYKGGDSCLFCDFCGNHRSKAGGMGFQGTG